MAESIIKKQGIKSATFSGTTTGTGSLLLQGPWDGKRIPMLAKLPDSSAARCSFFFYQNSLYIQCYTFNSSNTQVIPLANTAISGTYYYLDS